MEKDYIDEAQEEAGYRFGKELSPVELATEFAKFDFDSRIYHLKTLKASEGELTAREAAKRHRYEITLRNTHEMLRKVNR
jgi:hypothetical protein